MNIGIDIDGVMTKQDKYVKDNFSKYLEKKNIPFKYDKTRERYYQQFSVTPEDEDAFWDENIFHYAKHAKVMPNASKFIDKLHRDGNTITIITSRRRSSHQTPEGEKMRQAVKTWLAKNKIYYDNIYFGSERTGKIELAKESKIDVMIDDSVRNINELSQFIPVLVFRNQANKKAKGPNKIIVNSWKDVYKTINNFSNISKK